MGEEAGFLEDQQGHFAQVGDGRFMAKRRQGVARSLITELRLVAQGEQRFLAPGGRTGPGDLEHLLRRQIGLFEISRRLRKGAIMADIPA